VVVREGIPTCVHGKACGHSLAVFVGGGPLHVLFESRRWVEERRCVGEQVQGDIGCC
jgi:hypothetical protein